MLSSVYLSFSHFYIIIIIVGQLREDGYSVFVARNYKNEEEEEGGRKDEIGENEANPHLSDPTSFQIEERKEIGGEGEIPNNYCGFLSVLFCVRGLV